ncbi:MAG: hypothetical protein KBB86_02095, partial [Candidatus Pacebacteria bacterium]|nr:hypothetical protein [Candidatus Paceibacterota bacterium]
MTHKSIDALLASTMFLLFTMVTPHYEDVAKKIGFIDSAYAIANTTSYSSTTSSASNSSTNMTVTNTATSTTATTFNFMTTLSATTPVSHPVSGDSRNVELG